LQLCAGGRRPDALVKLSNLAVDAQISGGAHGSPIIGGRSRVPDQGHFGDRHQNLRIVRRRHSLVGPRKAQPAFRRYFECGDEPVRLHPDLWGQADLARREAAISGGHEQKEYHARHLRASRKK